MMEFSRLWVELADADSQSKSGGRNPSRHTECSVGRTKNNQQEITGPFLQRRDQSGDTGNPYIKDDARSFQRRVKGGWKCVSKFLRPKKLARRPVQGF